MDAKLTLAPVCQPPDLSSLGLAIAEHAPLPMATVEGAGHIVRYVNPAFCRLMDKSLEQLVGMPFCEILPERYLKLLDRVFRTGKPETHTEQEHSKPHAVFWSFTMWPVLADERPVGVMIQVTETAQFHEKTLAMNEALLLGSLHQHELTEAADSLNVQLRSEITERKKVEIALRESDERYRYLFNSIDEGFCVIEKVDGGVSESPDFRYLEANPAFAAQSGMSGMIGKTIRQVLPDEPEGWCLIFDTVLRTGEPIRFERELVSHGRILELYAFRLKDETHRRVAVLFKDITELKQAEQRQVLLTNELAHRGKNLLAVILSIATRSLSGTRPLAEAREVLIQRLHALARSQAVLIDGGFEGAPLSEIVRLEFESFSDQVKAVGPYVMLNPRITQTFSLLVHELATNAAKHGALSQADGQVAIQWSIKGVGAEARFNFQWQEFGGPPVVPPTHQGFGRTVLEKAAAQEFGALPKIGYAAEGLSYEIDALLSVVAAGTEGGGAAALE
jgi:PAS domain S-box-containing protein